MSEKIVQLNKKAYVHIEDWRNRPLQGGKYPYVYVDGNCLRRNWGGEYENVAVLVAIAVNEDGIEETLTYCAFPSEHWTRIRTNNVIGRLTREIRRRPRVMGRSRTAQLRPDAGLRPTSPRGGHPVGLQEIHEYEAFGGSFGRRLHCRLTSFSRSLQIHLRINLDGTG